MPSVIRLSDGKVFDVFGASHNTVWEHCRFLIYDKGCWTWEPTYDFMPAPSLGNNIVVTIDPPKELHPGPSPSAAEETLQHDPDLEAQ